MPKFFLILLFPSAHLLILSHVCDCLLLDISISRDIFEPVVSIIMPVLDINYLVNTFAPCLFEYENDGHRDHDKAQAKDESEHAIESQCIGRELLQINTSVCIEEHTDA